MEDRRIFPVRQSADLPFARFDFLHTFAPNLSQLLALALGGLFPAKTLLRKAYFLVRRSLGNGVPASELLLKWLSESSA
jgi:hypothetical protein